MRRFVSLACFLCVYVSSPNYPAGMIPACADEEKEETVAPVLESSDILWNGGVKGVWFPMPSAKRILRDLHEGRGAARLYSKLELRLERELNRNKLLEEQLASVFEELNVWKDAAESRARELENTIQPPWYKKNYTWAVIGFILGVGTTAVIVSAATK